MSTQVNVLTSGFVSLNARAFLYPILKNLDSLRSEGLLVHFYERVDPRVSQCDLLIIESKFYRDRWHSEDEVLEELSEFRAKIPKVFFFDVSDSAGMLLTKVLPYVDRYFKSQLYKDRSFYMQPLYGGRLYTDYYHRLWGVTDPDPHISSPIDAEYLDRLGVSWNIGCAHLGFAGPVLMGLYQRIRIAGLLRAPRQWTAPSPLRRGGASTRMTSNYRRQTVACQRAALLRVLNLPIAPKRTSRLRYLQELQREKVVLSPFGWGEVNIKDFEAFLSGALLLKPTMEGIETYPNLFVDGQTMVGHSWDLSDVNEKLESILASYQEFVEIAEEGQRRYRDYWRSLATGEWTERFCALVCS